MKSYSIEDLLVGQTYFPRSIARRFQGGEITFAEKREDKPAQSATIDKLRENR